MTAQAGKEEPYRTPVKRLLIPETEIVKNS